MKNGCFVLFTQGTLIQKLNSEGTEPIKLCVGQVDDDCDDCDEEMYSDDSIANVSYVVYSIICTTVHVKLVRQ